MDKKDELMSRLVKDLEGFADPDSVKPGWRTNSELVVSWEREGKQREQRFKLSGDDMSRSGAMLRPITEKNGPTTYSEFIRNIANLNHLSRSVIRSAKKEEAEEKKKGIVPSYYVSTKALVEKGGGTEEVLGNSDDLLQQEVEAAVRGEFASTPVFFVKGDAGAGKTILLKRFRDKQAQDFVEGKANFLFLYVSAQGRSLSRFDDAIAGELGKLRAAFSADAVPALVRNKLLVPIVDGFDELLGSQGYNGAFSSLQNLLNELEGDGVMVVSARSAFYEAEFFGAMSGEEEQGDMQVVRVSMLPWKDDEISRFLRGVRKTDKLSTSDSNALESLSPRDRDLLGKPFFTAQFPNYLDKRKGEGKGFLESLIDAFIERESEKIVGDDDEPLLAPDQHQSVFLEIAEKMWMSGERDLDRGDLENIAELALCDLSEGIVEEFKKKIASYGGMKAVREGAVMKFRFEHEVYFEHFLSLMIKDKLREGLRRTRVPATLNSGILPVVATRLAVWDAEVHNACLQLVNDLSKDPVSRDEVIALNLGQMLASSFAVRGEQGICSQNITVQGVKFRKCAFEKARLQNVHFLNCVFSEVDMVDSILEQCKAEACHVEGALIVSESTRLGIEGLVPGKNIFALTHKYGQGDVWNPEQMSEIMLHLGAVLRQSTRPPYSSKAQALIKLLGRFVNVYRSRRAPCEQDNSLGVFQSPDWLELRTLLLKHKIIKEAMKHPSGRPKTVFYKGQGISSMSDVLEFQTVPDVDDLPKGKIGDLWRAFRAM